VSGSLDLGRNGDRSHGLHREGNRVCLIRFEVVQMLP
jgi:hypothetical protein